MNAMNINNTQDVNVIASKIVLPGDLTKSGFRFIGWTINGVEGIFATDEVPAAAAQFISDSAPKTVMIAPQYEELPAETTVTYVIDGVERTEVIETAGIKRYMAPEVSGKKFTAWASDENGNDIVSFSKYVYFFVDELIDGGEPQTFKFYALYDKVIPVDESKFIYELDLKQDPQTTGKFKAVFRSIHVVPDGYTVTGFGALYTDQETVGLAGLTTENAKKISKAATPAQDSMYSYSITTTATKWLYFAGYVELRNNMTGEMKTLYTRTDQIQANPVV
jgi:hypothetical protein